MTAEPIVHRCCARHGDVDELIRHLVRDFAQVDAELVTREVARAVAAVRWIGLKQDELLVSELIARVQLELNSGDRPAVARLDPQPHPGRRGSAATAERCLAGSSANRSRQPAPQNT